MREIKWQNNPLFMDLCIETWGGRRHMLSLYNARLLQIKNVTNNFYTENKPGEGCVCHCLLAFQDKRGAKYKQFV
jgi:hypothetical protein